MSGGVDIVARDGTPVDFLETGGVPLNCVFHDGDLLITDFGDITEITDSAPMVGRLWRVEVGVEGMPLFRGAIG
jgi:gluconolactonase